MAAPVRLIRRRSNRTERLGLSITPALKSELETEAWESQRSLSDYVFGLLQNRGKWQRSIGSAGGYLLGPAKKKPPRPVGRPRRTEAS
jgi:hypothetical protein